MTLTPATLRLDLKCGKGAISEGEKCRVGPATKAKTGQLSPRELDRARSKLPGRAKLKKRYVALAAYAALTAASLYQIKNARQAYGEKFDPAQRYTTYTGTIGDPAAVIKQMQSSNKTGAPSLFGDVSFGKLGNKDIVVKRLGTKGIMGAAQITQMEAQGIISSKTADSLRKAQGSLQTNEVQGAELAGKLGFGPRVVAAGNNSLITEVAQGRPLSSQDRLARNGQKLLQEFNQNPGLAIKKIAKLRWLGFTKGTEISQANKAKIISNMARMHTAGISHNDLHPGNIFISNKGAQFIDFGTSERGGGAVAAEFVRLMNPPRFGLQQNGGMGYNLRSVDPQGFANTENKLRQAIGKRAGKLTASDIYKAVEASKDRVALEQRLQSVTDEYYRGYASRKPDWQTWRANAPKAGSTEEERRAFKSFFERNTPGLKRLDTQGRPCGQSHIATGKTCRKRGSFPTRKAIAAGLTAGAVGAVLLNKESRRAVIGAPAAAQRLTPAAFEQLKPPSKTERLHRAAQQANKEAEQAMGRAAQAEIERGVTVGKAMYAAGKATRASLRSGVRRHNLTVEKLRRRYEPGYRKPRRDNYIQYYAPVRLQPPFRLDGPSTEYYRTHPEAAAKKVRTQAKINRRPEERERRAELNRERRKRGIDGQGGPDMSHTTSGRMVAEAPSTNRARNGHGGQPRLRKDSGVVFVTPRLVDPGRQDACWAGYVQAGMKRKGKKEVPNCVPASSGLKKPRAQRDAEGDGKKYTKVVTNPETGRKKRIRYGAKGYRIAPGTDKGDRYCARSFGDMKSHGKDCSGADRNTPLCLSRAKWKCSGESSRRGDALTPGKS